MSAESDRLNSLIEAMTVRLRPVCEDWPHDAFAEMVRSLAEITQKYEGRPGMGEYDRRTGDRMVAELREALEESERRKPRNGE